MKLSIRASVYVAVAFALVAESAYPQTTSSSATEQAAFSKRTYTFKTVENIKLKADVYRREDEKQSGVIVWLHGGALIMGSRSGVPRQLQGLAEKHGLILVSLDYRLAPEAQLPEIIDDLRDGLSWVSRKGPTLFHADPSRIVVTGASAGGYLALMSAVVAEPPPQAIVSFWGFGDVDGDWTTKPSEAYRKGKLITKEEAWAGLGGKVITSTNQENGRGRSQFFLYLKQTGNWLNAVSGFDPETDRDRISPYCPVRNVTASFPPTLFLHGTADRDVPVSQTYGMVDALKRAGVDHEVIIIEGGGHSLWGGDPQQIQQAFERSLDYIREHLE